jgi:hypothetical protein
MEHMLRFGPNHGIQIIVTPPFFEEANRVRHIIVTLMRALDDAGIGSVLPDLPGTGESLTPVVDVTLADWRDALKSSADMIKNEGKILFSLSFRGGALIDDATNADYYWRCAPETGPRLVRDLMRTQLTRGAVDTTVGMQVLAGNTVRQSLIDAIGKPCHAAQSTHSAP